jgi:hypothetical protein
LFEIENPKKTTSHPVHSREIGSGFDVQICLKAFFFKKQKSNVSLVDKVPV